MPIFRSLVIISNAAAALLLIFQGAQALGAVTDPGNPEGTYKAIGKAQSVAEVDYLIRQFFAINYSIGILSGEFELGINARSKVISGAFIDGSDLTAYRQFARIFVEEWSKYPSELVRGSGLSTLAFVRSVSTAVGNTVENSGAFLDGNTIYFSVNKGVGNPEHLRHIIHHEFFHVIDLNRWVTFLPDPWAGITQESGGWYGAGGLNARDPNLSNALHPLASFVTGYATSSILEDRAELFSFLMTTSLYPLLWRWSQDDSYLAAKANLMLQFLNSKLSSQINLNFIENMILNSQATSVRIAKEEAAGAAAQAK